MPGNLRDEMEEVKRDERIAEGKKGGEKNTR